MRDVLTDTAIVDAIAAYLGTQESWSGADALDVIADLIGRVRPHPGQVHAEDYADEFAAATGRRVSHDCMP